MILVSDKLRQFVISLTVILVTLTIRGIAKLCFTLFMPHFYWVYDLWSSIGGVLSAYAEQLWWRRQQKKAIHAAYGLVPQVKSSGKYGGSLFIALLTAILAGVSPYASVLMADISPTLLRANYTSEHHSLKGWDLIPQNAFYDLNTTANPVSSSLFANKDVASLEFWQPVMQGWFNGDTHPEVHGLINKNNQSDMLISQDSLSAGLPFMTDEPWDIFWSLNAYTTASKVLTSKIYDPEFQQYDPVNWNLPPIRHNITQSETYMAYHWAMMNGDNNNALNQSSLVVSTSCVDNVTWDVYSFNITKRIQSHGSFDYKISDGNASDSDDTGVFEITDTDNLSPIEAKLDNFHYFSVNAESESDSSDSPNSFTYKANSSFTINQLINSTVDSTTEIYDLLQGSPKYLNLWGVGFVKGAVTPTDPNSASAEFIEFICVSNETCFLIYHTYEIQQLSHIQVPANLVGTGSIHGLVADIHVWDYNMSTAIDDLSSPLKTANLIADPLNACLMTSCEVYASAELVYNITKLVKVCIGVGVACVMIYVIERLFRREKNRITSYACVFEAIASSEFDHYQKLSERDAGNSKGFQNGKVGITSSVKY